MSKINEFLILLDEYLGGSPWFPYLLLGTGVFFTIYLKFPQIRFFRHALRIVTGKYEKDSMKGDTSHFQALTTALSGTIGTGNIGGVGLAIYIGGPAALFWMWATAFLGMTTKFVECTLSHKYRIVGDDGSIAGGPMFYMERKLKMKWLAVIFAAATLICAFGTGNMPQINNIATSVDSTFHIPPWITGGVLSVLLALIIIGGIKRIAWVTEKIVPFMSVVYLVGAFAVIIYNYENIIPSFQQIFSGILTGTAAAGGFLGSSFAFAFTKGVGRGLYSNEAGQGSAAIAHSAARADEPVSEGMVAILEPFIDTLIICTVTGLTILSSGVWLEKVPNVFQWSDMEIVEGVYSESDSSQVKELAVHINHGEGDTIKAFSGELTLENGRIVEGQNITVIHARSLAEEMTFSRDGSPVNGKIRVETGHVEDTDIQIEGKSLVHSAVLTAEAFKRGAFGDWGKYIVAIGLLLFAFSTVISWSYYGDRAVTYLWGTRFVLPYRIVYVIAFFGAALADTTIVWSLAAVAIVLMAVPNLFGILVLHKDMKQSISDYWNKFRTEHPDEAKRLNLK
ncbi:MAG: amino acid carrier protein [Deltaproteobacteria bacterium]|nr:amino acid carrier protein [Deltaproteobacteria bacterium]